jgi:hypothetical protein
MVVSSNATLDLLVYLRMTNTARAACRLRLRVQHFLPFGGRLVGHSNRNEYDEHMTTMEERLKNGA